MAEPAPVEVDHSFLRIENLENLRLISLRILLNLLASQRRPRSRAPRRIADHSGEVADQKNRSVAEILKMFQLAQHDGVPKVQVGSGRVHAELHAQRFARGARLLQLGAQFGLADDFRRALLEIRQLFVDRCEG